MARKASLWLALGILAGTPAGAYGHGAVYLGSLSGPQELPPNDSLATGFAIVSIDFDLFTMRVQVDFTGLSGEAAAAHIHGPTFPALGGTADAATTEPSFPEFPLGATSGEYDHMFDLTAADSYSPAFLARFQGSISRASNALFAGLDEGRMFLNIHTTAFPGGEIRGFLQSTPASDFTHNGLVDSVDLDVWRQAFFVDAAGDADQDGRTTGNDFLHWQRELGAVARIGAHQHHATAIPEPTSAPLAAIALLVATAQAKLGPCCRQPRRPVARLAKNVVDFGCVAEAARPSYRSLSRCTCVESGRPLLSLCWTALLARRRRGVDRPTPRGEGLASW